MYNKLNIFTIATNKYSTGPRFDVVTIYARIQSASPRTECNSIADKFILSKYAINIMCP
jgi:hypothetical protein